jgi:hypothetical protein
MPVVLIEREFAEPQIVAELQARQARVAWCFEAQRVRYVRSFVGRDARYAICMYDAPDAESVRVTQRTADVLVTRAWSAHVLLDEESAEPPGFSLVVAQRAMPETTTLEDVKHLLTDPKGCRSRLRLQLFGAYLSLDLRRMVCCYYTPDVESVRMSSRESGIPLERAWLGDVLLPGA